MIRPLILLISTAFLLAAAAGFAQSHPKVRSSSFSRPRGARPHRALPIHGNGLPLLAAVVPSKDDVLHAVNTTEHVGKHAIQHMGHWYTQHLAQKPLQTKIISGAVIAGLGDAIAQYQLGARDGLRMLTMVLTSLVLTPAVHYWYNYLSTFTGDPVKKTSKMLLVDQTVGALGFIAAFYLTHDLVHAVLLTATAAASVCPWSLSTSAEGMLDKLPETLLANWMIWPLVNLVNFYAVPLQYR